MRKITQIVLALITLSAICILSSGCDIVDVNRRMYDEGGVQLEVYADLNQFDGKMTSEQIEKTIEVLKRRLENIDEESVYINKFEKNSIVVIVTGDRDPYEIEWLLKRNSPLRFVILGEDHPKPGTKVLLAYDAGLIRDIDDPGKNSEPLTVNIDRGSAGNQVLFTGADIANASVTGRSDEYFLNLEISVPGGHNLMSSTRQLIGSSIGILLDNEILYVTDITSEFGSSVMFDDLTRQMAEQLKRVVDENRFPIPMKVRIDTVFDRKDSSDSLAGLKHKDPAVRIKTIQGLTSVDNPSEKSNEIIEALMLALDDGNINVRSEAIRTLGHWTGYGVMDNPGVLIPRMVEFLESGTVSEKIAVLETIPLFMQIDPGFMGFTTVKDIKTYMDYTGWAFENLESMEELTAAIVASTLDRNMDVVSRAWDCMNYIGPLMMSQRDEIIAIALDDDPERKILALEVLYHNGGSSG